MKKTIIICAASLFLGACGHHTYTVVENYNDGLKSSNMVVAGYPTSSTGEDKSQGLKLSERNPNAAPASFIPNATAFRMSGDYANNVAITLTPEGNLLYYPAPTDITADSEPVSLGNGWWLNNQGLAPNSVFTKYTFAEYAALPEAPSLQQLKLAVIPGAKVTGFIELPMKINEAKDNLDAVKKFIKDK